ncbi:MAG: hypothetical protein V1722_00340 [Candidatus Micrarchaeota archaeon]
MIPGLEKKIAVVKRASLPARVFDELVVLQQTQAMPSRTMRYKRILERDCANLKKAVRASKKHAEIAPAIARGSTHFYHTRNGLVFVRLPEKHSGKEFKPIIGRTRFAID